MAPLIPTQESLADWTSPTRLAALVTALGNFCLKYWNCPVPEPVRSGWELKLLASWPASLDRALWMSGRIGLALKISAPQLSYSENDPTKAKTLPALASVRALFCPQSNRSSRGRTLSLRP